MDKAVIIRRNMNILVYRIIVKKLEDELRIISYKMYLIYGRNIFSDYNWFFKMSSHLFKLLTNSFNKDKSND